MQRILLIAVTNDTDHDHRFAIRHSSVLLQHWDPPDCRRLIGD
jgi:hypothetical protein